MPEVKMFDPCFRSAIQEIFGVDTLDSRKINSAFYKQYRALVLHACGKRNKYTRNQEDLEAKLWVDFMGSAKNVSLVEMFFEQAQEAIPETVTAVEASDFLGVSLQVFTSGVHYYYLRVSEGKTPKQWMPTPISGSIQSPQAIYRSVDIIELSTNVDYVQRGTGVRVFPPPPPTKKHFVNYLRRCIAHRFANFCRTEARRHQERVWDTFADQRSVLEDPAPWEDRQETRCSQEEEAEVAILVQKLENSPARPYLQRLLVAVYDQGVSIQEAIEKCEEMTEGEKRAAIRAAKGYADSVVAA